VWCQIRLDGRSYTQILRGLMERGMLEAAWSLLDHIGVRGVQVRLIVH
jgi:pentatricopeptide repeat protein